MMLRRTNAAQVVSTYVDITKRYRNAKQLASAPRREVLAQLEPLGLAWRARNIRKMAEVLIKRFGGKVPSSYDSLKELPGVGDYVASAVACFAFGQTRTIVDTNTVRIIGRYFGFRTNPESRRRNAVKQIIFAVTSQRNTKEFNWAFLDFAALICKAIDPDCLHCPLRSRCAFGRKRLLKARSPNKAHGSD
jgi:A/G-specific adenine glycosylase